MYNMYEICSEIYFETSNICENILHMYGRIRIILCWVHQTMCRYKPQSRRIDQAIKHPATLNLAEFTAGQLEDRDHTTARARAVPASILGNLYKTLSMHDLGPDSWQWVQWLMTKPRRIHCRPRPHNGPGPGSTVTCQYPWKLVQNSINARSGPWFMAVSPMAAWPLPRAAQP